MPKHEVKILIDARELEMIALLERVYPHGNPELDTKQNLKHGDIQFLVDGKLSVVIERKRADDFRSSVTGYSEPLIPTQPQFTNPDQGLSNAQASFPKRKQQRFRTQRDNLIILRRENPGLLVMYIFEGSVHELYYGPNAKIKALDLAKLQKELVSKYGIPTQYGKNTIDTIRSIGHMRDIYVEHGSPEQCCAKANSETVHALGTQKNVQGVEGMQMSPGQFLGRALVNIHGVTPEKAEVIVRHYHTIPNLLHCYSRLTSEKARENMLAQFKVNDEGKHFGPKLSARIFHSLTPPMSEGEVIRPLPSKRTPKPKPPTKTLDTLVEVASRAPRRNVLED